MTLNMEQAYLLKAAMAAKVVGLMPMIKAISISQTDKGRSHICVRH
jgi:hypothetical protein